MQTNHHTILSKELGYRLSRIICAIKMTWPRVRAWSPHMCLRGILGSKGFDLYCGLWSKEPGPVGRVLVCGKEELAGPWDGLLSSAPEASGSSDIGSGLLQRELFVSLHGPRPSSAV